MKKRIIICPGHAVFIDGDIDDERNWILLDYQQNNGHVDRFISHIECAKAMYMQDPDNSLLVLSGGVTRPDIFKSEAQSYHHVVQQLNLREVNS